MMDGMLVVTFFFPALVVFNFTLTILTFLSTLLVSYGPEVYRSVAALVLGVLPHLEPNARGVHAVLQYEQQRQSSLLWPLFVSAVAAWTSLTTYGLGGAARHGKHGWRFVQPGRGGVRYVVLQALTWTTAAMAMAAPWTTFKSLGWLALLGVVPDHEQDPASLRGLLVVGSALGVLAHTYAFIGLMVYNNKTNTSSSSWNVLGGSSHAWWWLFLALQCSLVFCSLQLAVVMEMPSSSADTTDTTGDHQRTNVVVQCLLLCVVALLLAVPLGLTNAVAGKWRHGDSKYRLSMPFQGGRVFASLQATGWTLFALTLASLGVKMHAVVTRRDEQVVLLSYSLCLGVLAFACIAGSLFWFDPDQVTREGEGGEEGEEEEEEEEEEAVAPVSPSQVYSVLGRRLEHSTGKLEYLVQWRQDSRQAEWVKEPELLERDAGAVQRNSHLIMRGGGGSTPSPPVASTRTPSSTSRSSARMRSASPRRSRSIAAAAAQEAAEAVQEEEEEEGEWEEVEDENGNVFYYHARKRLTRLSAPPQHNTTRGADYPDSSSSEEDEDEDDDDDEEEEEEEEGAA